VLLKIPTYTITQGLQLCAFLKENFHSKHDVGIARTLKTQEITFMYKRNSHMEETLQKFMSIIHNKNKLLYMPFALKQNKKLKFKGV